LAIDAGADECISKNEIHEIHCPVNEIYNVKKKLEEKINNFISTEIGWLALNNVKITGEKKQEVIDFLETLEEDDDVQSVYTNVIFEN